MPLDQTMAAAVGATGAAPPMGPYGLNTAALMPPASTPIAQAAGLPALGPGALTPPPPAYPSAFEQFWSTMVPLESGGRNVPNYRFDPTHTAQGYAQITDTNWRAYAPKVPGAAQYPNAMAAPAAVQKAVAYQMWKEQGPAPWDKAHGGPLPVGGGSPYDQRRAEIASEEDALRKKMEGLTEQIGQLDARDPESLKELSHYREGMEKYQQQMLQLATNPPQFHPGQAMQQQGGMAMIIGMLMGALTKRPLIASLNAGAAAMNAYNKGDQEAYQRQIDQWKVSTDAMFKMAEFEHQMYEDTLRDEKLTEGQKLDKIRAQAEMMGNERQVLAAQSQNLDQLQRNDINTKIMLEQFKQKPMPFYDPNTKSWNAWYPGTNTVTPIGVPAGSQKGGASSGKKTPEQQAVDDAKAAEAEKLGRPLTPAEDQKIDEAEHNKFRSQPRSMPALIMQKAMEEHPDWTAKQAEEFAEDYRFHQAIATGIGSGMTGRQLDSLNTVASHIMLVKQYADALNNGKLPIANAIANRIARERGEPEITTYEAGRTIMADETVRLLTQTGGTEEDRRGMQQILGSRLSPDQFKGVFGLFVDFVGPRFEAIRQRVAGNDPADQAKFEERYLTPTAREVFAAFQSSAGTKGAASGSSKPPIIQNGWRYDPDTHQPIGPAQ